MEPELESSEQSEDEFEFRVPAYEGILDERENNADQEPARVPLAGTSDNCLNISRFFF